MFKTFIDDLALPEVLVSVLVTSLESNLLSQESVRPNPALTKPETISTINNRTTSLERQLVKAHQVTSPTLVRVYGRFNEIASR